MAVNSTTNEYVSCLASNRPYYTSALGASSVLIFDLSRLGGFNASAVLPAVSAACPLVEIDAVSSTIVPGIPTSVRSWLPTRLENLIPLYPTSLMQGAEIRTTSYQFVAINQSSSKGSDGALNKVLAAGVVISVVVVGLAAFS